MSPARKPAKKAVRKTAPAQKPDEPGVDELRFMVESAFERRTTLTPEEMEGSTRPVVERVIEGIENGEFRVAEPDGKGGWQVNEWLKKAVLLYFRTQDMEVIESYPAPRGHRACGMRFRRTRRSVPGSCPRTVPGRTRSLPCPGCGSTAAPLS